VYKIQENQQGSKSAAVLTGRLMGSETNVQSKRPHRRLVINCSCGWIRPML